jgi:hypothetical protein
MDFVVGDLLDPSVCPGPFDVVIERRVVQTFWEKGCPAALSALAARLGTVGIFLSFCLDDPFPKELGWAFHETGLFKASEFWCRAGGWVLWDGTPAPPLAGRVAWLIRSGTMKPPPERVG